MSITDWADRLYGSQKLDAGGPYLRDDPKPTTQQVSAVLHALADHSLNADMIARIEKLGADRSNLGSAWARTTGLGRYFQALGDALDLVEPVLSVGKDET